MDSRSKIRLLIRESIDALFEGYLRDMMAFGLTKSDIDENGYVTLFHGGKILPNRLKKGEIFFMTPSEDEATDYARMRNGQVFEIKVKPEDVHWNQGSYEVEFEDGGIIKNGYLIPNKKKEPSKVNREVFRYNFEDKFDNDSEWRYIKEYKGVKLGDVLPRSGWKVLDIIQYKSGHVQFKFKGDRWFDANMVINYEFKPTEN